MKILKKHYFLATIFLFIIEVLIALFVHDKIIRPYIGDVLVVILLYCFVKSICSFSTKKVAISILIFSFIIEFLQYLNIAKVLGLQNNKLAVIVIGNSFSWIDIFCYIVGIVVALIVEKFIDKSTN